MPAKNDINAIFKKLKGSLEKAASLPEMKKLGEAAVVIVVKRTRLGFGVASKFGQRQKLKPLSKLYIKARKTAPKLDSSTRPTKSNLTFTGQMLKSMKVLPTTKDGLIVIGPSGARSKDTLTNDQVAGFVTKAGRPFNNLSLNEFNQLVRIYRKQFTGLLKKLALIK